MRSGRVPRAADRRGRAQAPDAQGPARASTSTASSTRPGSARSVGTAGPPGPGPGGRRQVADHAQERRGPVPVAAGTALAEDRQHQRPEGRRRSRAGGRWRPSWPRRSPGRAELHPAAGPGPGLLRDGLEGGRRSPTWSSLSLFVPRNRMGDPAPFRETATWPSSRRSSPPSPRPWWPCPTAIPSSSARSRRSRPSWSATASGAGSATRRSTSTRSSRRSRAS
ncbi:MAG: hypothetical protein MZW92_03090 [Comamonadaceae bacterium]|nr:hypothetical protein [Comamonadaceae bacterium]